jgi:hypothetical protein
LIERRQLVPVGNEQARRTTAISGRSRAVTWAGSYGSMLELVQNDTNASRAIGLGILAVLVYATYVLGPA